MLRFIPACAGNSQADELCCPSVAVHPRVCGEQPPRRLKNASSAGSSPRVRGTVGAEIGQVARCRFIPACAGNSTLGCEVHWATPVHPRVCGEQIDPLQETYREYGSSPRVRGTVFDPYAFRGQFRFIPACAGNRYTVRARFRGSAVHPRVCGEQSTVRAQECCWRGSSPRVRGTVLTGEDESVLRRFIPACAGNRTHHFAVS